VGGSLAAWYVRHHKDLCSVQIVKVNRDSKYVCIDLWSRQNRKPIEPGISYVVDDKLFSVPGPVWGQNNLLLTALVRENFYTITRVDFGKAQNSLRNSRDCLKALRYGRNPMHIQRQWANYDQFPSHSPKKYIPHTLKSLGTNTEYFTIIDSPRQKALNISSILEVFGCGSSTNHTPDRCI